MDGCKWPDKPCVFYELGREWRQLQFRYSVVLDALCREREHLYLLSSGEARETGDKLDALIAYMQHPTEASSERLNKALEGS